MQNNLLIELTIKFVRKLTISLFTIVKKSELKVNGSISL